MKIKVSVRKLSKQPQSREKPDSRTLTSSTFRWLSLRNPRNIIIIAEIAVFAILVAEAYLTLIGLKGGPTSGFSINRW